MLLLARCVLALIGFIAGWFISYWVYFAGYDLAGSPFLGRGMPFLLGIGVAVFILAATEHLRHGLLSSILLGAVMLGSIGFVAGFFGPMIFAPGANQGPLLGLLMTGPGGFLLGGPLGAAWWWVKQRLRQRRAAA